MGRQVETLKIFNEELKKQLIMVNPSLGVDAIPVVVLIGKAIETTIQRLEEEGG